MTLGETHGATSGRWPTPGDGSEAPKEGSAAQLSQSRRQLPPAAGRWARNMNFKALRAFQLIAERGSLSAAASDLCLSQPAVSRLVAMLEAELDLRLFNRTGRGLSMTREGKLFYDMTRHILAGVEEIPRIAKDIQAGDRQLHLLTTPRIAQAVIAPALSLLRKENARLHCRVDVLSRADLEKGINAGRFDLAIAAIPLAPLPSNVELQPLFEVRVEAVLPLHHPLAERSHLTAADLAEVDLIGPWHDPIWRQQMSDLLPSRRSNTNCTVETCSAQLAYQMVSDGTGIAFLDRLSTRGLDHSKVAFRPVSPEKWIAFGYISSRSKPLSPNASQFIIAAKQIISEFQLYSRNNSEGVRLSTANAVPLTR